MRTIPIIGALLAIGLTGAPAQDQEKTLVDKIWDKARNRNLASPMQNVNYSAGGTVNIREYKTGGYTKVRSAHSREFRAKSFLGIRNPWLGENVFTTGASNYAQKTAPNGGRKYAAPVFATHDYRPGTRKSQISSTLPDSLKPRKASVTPKAQGGIDQFTQNLNKEMTIEEVRQLLNKSR